ncbi:hypothetical protein DCS_01679 [Drechmeria coniospora]|uniref:DNA endonuclease activator Ctp1 C-terminal domain-containing protein n=1 Tax=Drechmeria coniospora TaxID=98403 RepID=A0A151GU54_DRECN|nr:hypothetical protein DCS_01679 [Drechmeria coniospora]KYK60542.1 hypothetical protein DCS_01679 [Drechmeria coniospora]
MAGLRAWFDTGRPALFAALEEVCERIDRDLIAEQDGNKNNRKQCLEAAGAAPSVAEDVRLRLGELTGAQEELDEPPTSTAQLLSTSTPLPYPSTVRCNSSDVEVLQAECSALRRKFNALAANFKTAKDALRRRKEEREQWEQGYADMLCLLKAAEKVHGIHILDRAEELIQASAAMSPAVPDASIREGPPLLLDPEDISDNNGRSASNILSESTQGDADDRPGDELPPLRTQDENSTFGIKPESSSDVPVVVSERSVRKRKRKNSTSEAQVKSERTDSSPIIFGEGIAVHTQESIDLGDIEQRIVTPRKPKDSESTEQTNTTVDGSIQKLLAAPLTTPGMPSPPPPPTATQRFALAPLDSNTRRSSSDGHKPYFGQKRKRLGYAISTVAEDGDEYQTHPLKGNNHDMTPSSERSTGRLEMLLNSPSPATERIISRPSGNRRDRPRPAGDRLPIPGRRALPFEKGTGQASRSPLAQVDLASGVNTPPTDRSVRQRASVPNHASTTSSLRSKPLSELRLDDFRINPLVNDGYDFAYSEVVRNKDDRACLPGCKDMHCCGRQFRALAMSQRPNPPLTSAQRIEERKLLEEYLGDSAFRLAMMNKDEREELWVEAKAQELANKYGKHKHRFSRMQSPPGFWDADFPSTQELEAERAEASKRERQAISERRREAMRPGGRWLFKDE